MRLPHEIAIELLERDRKTEDCIDLALDVLGVPEDETTTVPHEKIGTVYCRDWYYRRWSDRVLSPRDFVLEVQQIIISELRRKLGDSE